MVEKSVVPNIPSITDVANEGTSAVQQMSTPMGNPNEVSIFCGTCGLAFGKCECDMFTAVPTQSDPVVPIQSDPVPPQTPKVKRVPVDHQTSRLYWPFIILMGKIAHYANEKYGSVEQYADGRLEGEKSPINHIAGHIAEYVSRKPHDKWPDDPRMHLAAIAYNAMMEALYYEQGGPTVPDSLYKKKVSQS